MNARNAEGRIISSLSIVYLAFLSIRARFLSSVMSFLNDMFINLFVQKPLLDSSISQYCPLLGQYLIRLEATMICLKSLSEFRSFCAVSVNSTRQKALFCL